MRLFIHKSELYPKHAPWFVSDLIFNHYQWRQSLWCV